MSEKKKLEEETSEENGKEAYGEIKGVAGTILAGEGQSQGTISLPFVLSSSGPSIASTVLTDDFDSSLLFFRTKSFDRQFQLETDISKLNNQLRTLAKELHDEKKNRKQVQADYKDIKEELAKKERLKHVAGRVHEHALEKLFTSDSFLQKFTKGTYQEMVVLSIDIRRSTELMLKAKTPALFASFITSLCKKLTTCIIKNYGVFDKFTGDGILAFFPVFYAGANAILFSVKAAQECHKIFEDHYKESRHFFKTIPKEIGLGIGIDCGKACVTIVNNNLTVVGEPVVYACRFSSCDCGTTVLNQSAMEKMQKGFGRFSRFQECEVEVKNEGKTIAYTVDIDLDSIEYKRPTWDRINK